MVFAAKAHGLHLRLEAARNRHARGRKAESAPQAQQAPYERGEGEAMTEAEITTEKRYRFAEAIALGRTPERAEAEVAEWEAKVRASGVVTKSRESLF